MRRTVTGRAVASLQGTSRASARAVDVQRRSLVWPVTSSARGGSFLARPGTCRAGPAAPLGVPTTARRLLPLSPVAIAPFRFAHASRSRRPLRYAAGRARPRGCGGAGPA